VSLPYPKYGLKSLYLFPYHQTREDYERATGSVCPPFDSARAPKNWLDPSAAKSTKRNVAYQFALVTADNGTAIPGPDGKPQLDVLVLKKEEAATVNIPPNATNVPGADVPEVPCPLRPLEPDEELAFGFGGVVEVRNKRLYAEATETGDFTAADRQCLFAIAAKVGVTI
jgi:hypothetical protein